MTTPKPTTAPPCEHAWVCQMHTHCTKCGVSNQAPDNLDAIIAEMRETAARGEHGHGLQLLGWADRLAALQALNSRERHLRETAERQVERMALCPDHRDKTTGRCIVCQAEDRTNAEWHHRKEKL